MVGLGLTTNGTADRASKGLWLPIRPVGDDSSGEMPFRAMRRWPFDGRLLF